VTGVTDKVLRSDARRNLELILQAAGEAFAEGGLEVGVADIARRAGVGTATIFRRFPTKEDLVAAVFEARLQEIVSIARECGELDGGIEAVRRFFEQAIDFQIRDRGFLESVGKRRFAGDPRFTACRDDIHAAIEQLVDQAQVSGELRADVSATDLLVLLHSLGSGAMFVERQGRNFRMRYVDLMLDGLRPEGASKLRCAPPSLEEMDAASDAQDCV
jgi:AcrR family transcriptional regulator